MSSISRNEVPLPVPYLENEAEIGRCLEFVFELFAIVDIYIVKLDETHQVTRCLWGKKNIIPSAQPRYFPSVFLLLLSLDSLSLKRYQLKMFAVDNFPPLLKILTVTEAYVNTTLGSMLPGYIESRHVFVGVVLMSNMMSVCVCVGLARATLS